MVQNLKARLAGWLAGWLAGGLAGWLAAFSRIALEATPVVTRARAMTLYTPKLP